MSTDRAYVHVDPATGVADPDDLGDGADGTGDNVLHDDGTWSPEAGGGGVTDHGALTGLADDDHPQYTTAAELAAYAQPLDSDLTAIAAIAPANDDVIQRKAGAWTNRTLAQLIADLAALGTTFQPLDADLTAIAALTTTAYGRSVLEVANAAALRTLAAVVIGTDVQAYDAELAALAGLVSAADKLPYFTGAGTAALADLTAAGRAIIDDADAAAQRTTLGLGALAVLGSLTHAATTGQTVNDHHNRDHAATHGPAAADALKLDDLAAPDDNTDLNASATAHGLLRKLDSNASHYLAGDGTWGTPSGSGVSHTNSETIQSGDVSMASANTWYDGPSVSLAAGTWLVSWKLLFQSGGASLRSFYSRLLQGATEIDYVETWLNQNGYRVGVAGFAIVTLGSTTTVKSQGRSDVATNTMSRDGGNGSAHMGGKIDAILIA